MQSEVIDSSLLGLYLADHLAGAAAGVGRIRHMARKYRNTPLAPELFELASQIPAEQAFLAQIITDLGLRQRRLRRFVVGTGERLGRLKFNRRLFRPSPLTPFFEVEIMRGAVAGKMGGWQTLAHYSDMLGLPPGRCEELVEQSRAQIATLDALHSRLRGRVFRVPPPEELGV